MQSCSVPQDILQRILNQESSDDAHSGRQTGSTDTLAFQGTFIDLTGENQRWSALERVTRR